MLSIKSLEFVLRHQYLEVNKLNMDFVIGLPCTRWQYYLLWVIVDHVMKSAHLILIKVSYSTKDNAKLNLREMFRLNGVPLSIISDRVTQFTSLFWKSFQTGLCTLIRMTFHPQNDGQSKHTIQTFEYMIRTCVIDFKSNWDDHFRLIEFVYNNSYRSSINMDPFESLYGRRPKSPISLFEVGEFALIDPELINYLWRKFELLEKD